MPEHFDLPHLDVFSVIDTKLLYVIKAGKVNRIKLLHDALRKFYFDALWMLLSLQCLFKSLVWIDT